jgi:hypothetical protein
MLLNFKSRREGIPDFRGAISKEHLDMTEHELVLRPPTRLAVSPIACSTRLHRQQWQRRTTPAHDHRQTKIHRRGARRQEPGTLISKNPATAVPVPAALPLFATGIGGLGLLGWRRKRKAQAVARTNKA